jgi:hypothetical protein
MKSYDLSGNLSKCYRPKNGLKWQYHHGMADSGYFVYFKNKKNADEFVRYANRFVKNMFMQTNDVYTDLFVMWRSVYMHFPKTDRGFAKILTHFDNVNFQFDRWTVRHTFGNGTYGNFIFAAPKRIQNDLIDLAQILRVYAKLCSNTSLIYQIDSKITYLNFLALQYKQFDQYTKEEGSLTKIIKLPILQMVAVS